MEYTFKTITALFSFIKLKTDDKTDVLLFKTLNYNILQALFASSIKYLPFF
jgi:hypothetical protein